MEIYYAENINSEPFCLAVDSKGKAVYLEEYMEYKDVLERDFSNFENLDDAEKAANVYGHPGYIIDFIPNDWLFVKCIKEV